jgi:hypothetical protein
MAGTVSGRPGERLPNRPGARTRWCAYGVLTESQRAGDIMQSVKPHDEDVGGVRYSVDATEPHTTGAQGPESAPAWRPADQAFAGEALCVRM